MIPYFHSIDAVIFYPRPQRKGKYGIFKYFQKKHASTICSEDQRCSARGYSQSQFTFVMRNVRDRGYPFKCVYLIFSYLFQPY